MTTLVRKEPGLERVAPMCEIRDCGKRADYFWHSGFGPAGLGWTPICAPHADEIAEHGAFVVAPIAESSGPEYLGSDRVAHARPLERP